MGGDRIKRGPSDGPPDGRLGVGQLHSKMDPTSALIFKILKAQNTLRNSTQSNRRSSFLLYTFAGPNMAFNRPPHKTLEPAVDTTQSPGEAGHLSKEEEEEEVEIEAEELEKLESEVKEMANKIVECRTSLPDQLKATLASVLSAQRPVLADIDSRSNLGPAADANPGLGEEVKSNKSALLTEGDQMIAEKVQLLKDKISSNISAIPVVLKRMKECMSKLDNLDSDNESIHPAFRKEKTS